jgi:enamine deaminase RidA (YjgF/YER057c/UK114 family)
LLVNATLPVFKQLYHLHETNSRNFNQLPLFILSCTGCKESANKSTDKKLATLKIKLPQVPKAPGSYVDASRVGNLVFFSGKGLRQSNGEYIIGKVGTDLSIQAGYAAATLTALNQLAVLKESRLLNRIKRIVKVNGYVNSSDSFYDQQKIMDGFSDLMLEIFGEAGRHSRTSVSASSLPMNMAIEVEMVVEVEQVISKKFTGS